MTRLDKDFDTIETSKHWEYNLFHTFLPQPPILHLPLTRVVHL